MTKKDFIILIAPIIILTLVASLALYTSGMTRRFKSDYLHDPGYMTFVEDVKSGKRQLATDQWLDGMHRVRTTGDMYRQGGLIIGTRMEFLGGASLIGVVFQIGAILHIRKRLNKP